jgi:ABC-type multidrug transport system fused ATPase/permease subunit
VRRIEIKFFIMFSINNKSATSSSSFVKRPKNLLLRQELDRFEKKQQETKNDDEVSSNKPRKPISEFLKTLNDANRNGNNEQESNDEESDINNEFNDGNNHGPTMSFHTILKSLTFTEFSFTFNDIIRYSICALVAFMVLMYVFPQNLLLLFLLLVLMILIVVYIAVCRKIYKIQYKPINRQKLDALRNVYFTGRHNQVNSQPSKN